MLHRKSKNLFFSVINCLQLISDGDSPVTVTSDLSPAVQRLDAVNSLKLCAKNVDGYAEWERCAKEFTCGSSWRTGHLSSVSGNCMQRWRSTVTTCQRLNALRQPKAKKRLASSLADEVLPPSLSGK